jgi:hypothetical protein
LTGAGGQKPRNLCLAPSISHSWHRRRSSQRVDSRFGRRREPSDTLWVCSDDLSSARINIADSKSGSALIGFDLRTGTGKVRAEFAGKHMQTMVLAYLDA